MASSSCVRPSGPPAPLSRSKPVELTSASGVPMVLIPAGRFLMGSESGAPDERPRHGVNLSAFVMDKFEVSQQQFAAFELPDPSHFKGPQRPVEQVRWSDAALFCNERSRREGLQPCYDEATFVCDFAASGYRLPTEAEWEYAARAGSDADYGFAGGAAVLPSHACYAENSTAKTDPVGGKRPNDWGLHDMFGNVSEWCHDVYSDSYYASSPVENPRGPADGKQRAIRGGSFKSSDAACRATLRMYDVPGITDACFARDTYGFRCVRRPSPEELTALDLTALDLRAPTGKAGRG
jgi:formylglycine-generating enzyme required for sulfatase activity